MARVLPSVVVTLEKIVGGGQALATMDDGRKLFAWGGLPGEEVEVQITKKKSKYAEGVVIRVIRPSKDRVQPHDSDSYLSTSPWQMMSFEAEQQHKSHLINEAFTLHDIQLSPASIYTDGNDYQYRNKVEFSWYGYTDDNGNEQLDLAFFRRGTKGKIPIETSALLPEPIITLAKQIRDHLRDGEVNARQLKTLLIRSNQNGNCVWQLYTKDEDVNAIHEQDAATFSAQGGEVIYSNPRSPASVITKRMASFGNTTLQDTILGVPFRYATEGFFQINLPVYEKALKDMQAWIPKDIPTVDMYSGVGTIGLTIGGDNVTLVEINEHAVREMRRNITDLKLNARPVLAASEDALEHITHDKTLIVDPPRAGLHDNVVQKILEAVPKRVIYLSCNPVTQARDAQKLLPHYKIIYHQGYNFFPRTPHIEHLIVLESTI